VRGSADKLFNQRSKKVLRCYSYYISNLVDYAAFDTYTLWIERHKFISIILDTIAFCDFCISKSDL